MGEKLLNAASLLPDDRDVEYYHEHGYWISPPIIPSDLLATARRGMDRLYAFDVDHTVEVRPDARDLGTYTHWGWLPEHGGVLRKNDYASLRVDELARLVSYPAIAACAAKLAGAEELRLWHDQLLYKPLTDGTGGGNIKWHTDRYYWMTCSSEDMLTAWIPFADVSASDGAMCVVDGSHRWSDQLTLRWQAEEFSVIDDVLSDHGSRLVPIALEAGQVSFHHCKMIHGSGPNYGAAPRRAMAVHFQPGTNHYVERGHHHPNDELVTRTEEGLPDYADPRICPRLFPSDRSIMPV